VQQILHNSRLGHPQSISTSFYLCSPKLLSDDSSTMGFFLKTGFFLPFDILPFTRAAVSLPGLSSRENPEPMSLEQARGAWWISKNRESVVKHMLLCSPEQLAMGERIAMEDFRRRLKV
jgi:hypothetical protein